MHDYFRFKELGTSYKTEILAGITTFLTMAYIIVVNPAILEAAGIPKGPSMTATILSAAFGTLIMGFIARRPFAVAPYMGENAFIAYTVVKVLGYTWQAALGAIFLAGILFTILTLLRIRGWLAESIPQNLKYAFAAGIGLFLAFIGLNETGIITIGVPGAPVSLGTLSKPEVLLAILGFSVMTILTIKKVHGAIIIGIISVTTISILSGFTPIPKAIIGLPPSISDIFFKFDVKAVLSVKALPVILIVFIMAFVDTIGTLIGLSARAGFLDARGNLPQIEKPMLADALANIAAPLFGTTTAGAYIESAAGIEEGGRSGFTSVVVAILFLLALFATPFLTSTPAFAYGPALILIGCFMLKPVTHLNFTDYTELVPSFLTISLISFSYNIGVGITAGLIVYPLLKTLSGRVKEVPAGLWIMATLSLLFFIVYPYK
jgi:AGZA family xanthine/uracil permease-like MFS transporter